MYRNEQKSCDDDNKTAQAHRKWIRTLAHEFCVESINSVVEAKIPNFVECTEVNEYMKAVSIGYNNEMLCNGVEESSGAGQGKLFYDRLQSCRLRAQEAHDRPDPEPNESV